MDTEIVLLIKAAVVAALSSGLVIWALKSWFITRLKLSIKHEYEAEMAKIKAELSIFGNAEKFRFEQYHARAIAALGDIYASLIVLFSRMANFVSQNQGPDVFNVSNQKAVDLEVAWVNFWGEFLPKRIYLSEEMVAKISGFAKILHAKSNEFKFGVVIDAKDRFTKWKEIDDYVIKEGEKMLLEIEKGIRSVIYK